MKKTRQEKGITLIALIISIIILLILAAVTINAITGDGIIAKAQKAAEDYKTKADEEADLLDSYLSQLEDADQSGASGSGGTGTIQIGVKYTANTQLTDGSGDKFWIPSGYAVVLDENGKALVDKGIVITDAVDESGKSTGNEWVWIPGTASEMFTTSSSGVNSGKLYDFSSSGATVLTSSEYYEPGIQGHVTSWENTVDGEWISTTPDRTPTAELQAKFDSMVESVKKFGGYYISRYESGKLNSKTVSKKGATTTTSYNLADLKNNNSSIEISEIWGCQWDNTLRWLVSSGNKTWEELIDSRDWGNFNENIYDFEGSVWVEGTTYWDETMLNEYDNTYGFWNTTEGYWKEDDEREKYPDKLGELCTTGYSEMWKAGNIYDLAGNAYEGTLETQYSTGWYCGTYGRGGGWWDTDSWRSGSVASRVAELFEPDAFRFVLMLQ